MYLNSNINVFGIPAHPFRLILLVTTGSPVKRKVRRALLVVIIRYANLLIPGHTEKHTTKRQQQGMDTSSSMRC